MRAFESCALPNEAFHHRDHLRLARLYLLAADCGAASERFAKSLLRFATHHGGAQKYHRTMLLAWMHLIAAAMRESPAATFDELLAAHPELVNRHALLAYYSRGRLATDSAQTGWVEPDLQPLP